MLRFSANESRSSYLRCSVYQTSVSVNVSVVHFVVDILKTNSNELCQSSHLFQISSNPFKLGFKSLPFLIIIAHSTRILARGRVMPWGWRGWKETPVIIWIIWTIVGTIIAISTPPWWWWRWLPGRTIGVWTIATPAILKVIFETWARGSIGTFKLKPARWGCTVPVTTLPWRTFCITFILKTLPRTRTPTKTK